MLVVTGEGFCGRCDQPYSVAPGLGCPNVHTTEYPPDDWQKTSENYKKWSLAHDSEERKNIRVVLRMVENGFNKQAVDYIKKYLLKDPWE